MKCREFLYNATNGFDRIPQTVIIDGGNDALRRESADLLAMALICQNGNACQMCDACKRVQTHNHTEVTYVEREKDKKTIPVSAARSIRTKAFVNPVESDVRVFIIPEAQSLGEEAQNALLKILEEPPVFDRFILCAENAGALLSTIRSRSVRMTLPALFEADITQKDGELAKKIAWALLNSDEASLVYLFPSLEKDRLTALSAIQKLKLIFRDAIVRQYGGKPFNDLDETAEMSSYWTNIQLTECIRCCEHTEKMLESNVKTGLALANLFNSLMSARSL